MAVKKGYNRYFIIFQEEDKGYGMAIDKQPTGYTKIETRNGRCKITSYVQNLVKEKGPYNCWLIDSSSNPPVLAKMGEIRVDDTGRGETWWEYQEENICDTELPFDRFNVSAIVVEGDNIYCPLTGYMGKEKAPWRDRIAYTPRGLEKGIKAEENSEEELNEEAKKFKEYEAKISKENENKDKKPMEKKKEEESKDNPLKSKESKIGTKGASPLEKKDNKSEDIKGASSGGAKEKLPGEAKKEEKPANNNLGNIGFIGEDNKYSDTEKDQELMEENMKRDRKKKRTFAPIFHNILENFEEEKGISDEFNRARWWKIPLDYDISIDEDNYYPYYCAIYHLKMAYPYINYIRYFGNRGYYYFGLQYDDNDEIKHIMYGIEGNSTERDQPYIGMTGFIKWVKMKKNNIGLWVMYYNPYTGCVMIPKKR